MTKNSREVTSLLFINERSSAADVPQPSTSAADETKNIDTNDSNDLFGDPSIGALYSDTVVSDSEARLHLHVRQHSLQTC